MVFSSFSFLFLFLPAALLAYYIVPQRLRSVRNGVLLCFSLAFYFFGEPKGIFLITGMILLSYLAALGMDKTSRPGLRRLLLTVTLVLSMGALCFYKYLGFLLDNLNSLFRTSLPVPEIVMPIGISFFTFQSMSYVIDVYRKKVPAQKNPFRVALYVSLFPQLIAGPIVRYETVANELADRKETLEAFSQGLGRFILGLFKKVFFANTLGSAAETLFGLTSRSALLAWVGALLYALQIYYDFSGYSDMAIGLGRIFGFHFLENFDHPYCAASITDFWRRWHISLSSWFRDYVYIPLGGNRKGLPRQLLNLLIVWGLTGLWHGASWNFLLWGLYFALLLILEKLFLGRLLEKLPKLLRHLYALILILAGWVIFNCTSLPQLGQYLPDLFRFRAVSSADWGYCLYLLRQHWPTLLPALAFCLPLRTRLETALGDKPWFPAARVAVLLLLLGISLFSLTTGSFNPFIYFRF